MSQIFKWFYVIYAWGQDVIGLFTMTINELVAQSSLDPPLSEVVDYLTSPFGNWSLIQFIFGAGFVALVAITLLKWVVGIVT